MYLNNKQFNIWIKMLRQQLKTFDKKMVLLGRARQALMEAVV